METWIPPARPRISSLSCWVWAGLSGNGGIDLRGVSSPRGAPAGARKADAMGRQLAGAPLRATVPMKLRVPAADAGGIEQRPARLALQLATDDGALAIRRERSQLSPTSWRKLVRVLGAWSR